MRADLKELCEKFQAAYDAGLMTDEQLEPMRAELLKSVEELQKLAGVDDEDQDLALTVLGLLGHPTEEDDGTTETEEEPHDTVVEHVTPEVTTSRPNPMAKAFAGAIRRPVVAEEEPPAALAPLKVPATMRPASTTLGTPVPPPPVIESQAAPPVKEQSPAAASAAPPVLPSETAEEAELARMREENVRRIDRYNAAVEEINRRGEQLTLREARVKRLEEELDVERQRSADWRNEVYRLQAAAAPIEAPPVPLEHERFIPHAENLPVEEASRRAGPAPATGQLDWLKIGVIAALLAVLILGIWLGWKLYPASDEATPDTKSNVTEQTSEEPAAPAPPKPAKKPTTKKVVQPAEEEEKAKEAPTEEASPKVEEPPEEEAKPAEPSPPEPTKPPEPKAAKSCDEDPTQASCLEGEDEVMKKVLGNKL